MIDQQWLDERCYSDPADIEPELDKLVEDAGRLAEFEYKLVEDIKEHKRRLARLPYIIAKLEARRMSIGHELIDVLERHDQLAEVHRLLRAQQSTEVEA